jgi:hypothetical protein
MSRKEKILKRFISLSKDFSWQELTVLLNGFDYSEIKTGKTSGYGAAFYNEKTEHLIRLHRPHPGSILKRYQIELILEELISKGVINER